MPRFQVQGVHEEVTLGDLIAAVIDVTDDERETIAVVLQMLQSGSARLLRRCGS